MSSVTQNQILDMIKVVKSQSIISFRTCSETSAVFTESNTNRVFNTLRQLENKRKHA